jgi:protein-S-isoprenylcysteine O-methyltransferase Ste14
LSIDVDLFMRTALGVELLSMGIVRGAYAGMALGEKKGRRFKEKPMVLVGMGIIGIAFYYSLVTYLFSWDPAWMDIGLPDAVRWAGLAISFLCLGFLCWVFKTIGKAGAKYVITFDDQKLVTTGPYARIRHPMYSGAFVWAVSVLLFTDHWGVGGCFLALILFVVVFRLRSEEEVLLERFGDDYREYMARTGRFWPSRRA